MIKQLQDPTTKAVRLHGSKKVQTMLGQVDSDEQLRVLADETLPPVVVLTNADAAGGANVQACAGYICDV